MPNWCYNRVRIDADSDQVEKLKEIYEIFENHSDLSNRTPPPAGNPNSSSNQVGSPVYNVARLWDTPFLHGTLHRSSRNGHNMPLVHLWVRVEQLVVQVIHQSKLKRC